MSYPPLRVGTVTLGKSTYPAIVGKTKGGTREIFVCGEHIDRFLRRFRVDELMTLDAIKIEVSRKL